MYLKPCPFCGAGAETEPWHGGGPDKIAISCGNEYCPAGPSVVHDDPETAVEDWNTRADPVGLDAMAAALAEEGG